MSAAADAVAGELVQADDLKDVNSAVARFDAVAAGVAALQKQYGGVIYDVTTPKGMDSAKEARRAIREPRYEIEKVRKAAKAPILALGRRIDGEAERITKQLLAIECPIDQQIKVEEDRKEAERQAAIEAERQRIAAIEAQIDAMRQAPADVAGKAADVIRARLDALYEPSEFDFQERVDIAKSVRADIIARLEQMLAEREAFDADQLRLAEERARLEEQRRKDTEAAAQRQREEDERRRQEDARLQQERERLAAERAEADRIERERQEQQRKDREAQELAQMRLQEIEGIRHQVMIASVGRLGVRAGGTLECAEETLAETESWVIDEQRFGPMLGAAQSAKDRAIAQIKAVVEQRREEKQQREAQAAEQQRIAQERQQLAWEREYNTAFAAIVAAGARGVAASTPEEAESVLAELRDMVLGSEAYGDDLAAALRTLRSVKFGSIEDHRDSLVAALEAAKVPDPPPPAAAELTSAAVSSPPASDSAAAVVDPEDEVGALLAQYPYPGHEELLRAVATHFEVPREAARQWLLQWAECNGVVL